MAISAVFLGLVLGLVEPSAFPTALQRPDFQAFALVMGFVYYLELIVWFYAVRHIDVSLASSIATPWPALTMVLATVFLGDAVAGYQIAVFVIVAVSIYGLIVAGLRKDRARHG